MTATEVTKDKSVGSFESANVEKEKAARSSVFAAIFLSSIKAVVGIMTGSLGILSEALHSSLDLVAALVTWFAVKFAGKPADEDHQYGHTKVESISALVELMLLLITCFWIVLEAVERLQKGAMPEVNFWSFAVMMISIIVDVSRSRMLYRIAEKHNSQALAADALHFSSDVISSSVVIIGLIFAYFGNVKADPLAALGVAVIVAFAMINLGREALDVLLDKAPAGMAKGIREATLGIEGVEAINTLRVRGGGGKEGFADLSLVLGKDLAFEQAHGISHQVEMAIKERFPNCHVQVHFEPGSRAAEDLLTRIRRAALCQKGVVNVHNLDLLDGSNTLHVILHVEVDEKTQLSIAHEISAQLESTIQEMDKRISRVITHIEPARRELCEMTDVTEKYAGIVKKIREQCKCLPDLTDCHNLKIISTHNRLKLELHVRTDGATPVFQAHSLSWEFENKIKQAIPELGDVCIHMEPIQKVAKS